MDRNDICYLISKTYTQDDCGVTSVTEAKKQVYCSVRSVSHREKVDNGLIGLNSAYQLSVFRFDYNDEEIVEFQGKRFVVYDATEYNDKVRVYIKLEKGVDDEIQLDTSVQGHSD